jgi:cbb3-type cytochrome oxidase subunit 3
MHLIYYGYISGILYLLLGCSLLTLTNWARKGIIYFQVATVVLGIFLTPQINRIMFEASNKVGLTQKELTSLLNIFNIIGPILQIIFTILVIYFFTRPKVKAQFNKSNP